ncbi:MAG: HDOD domain-containing protein [Gammaproteobacteria bacterium]|nr:HDOD domain-containing protein [Gammaproteobacteria bacterium]
MTPKDIIAQTKTLFSLPDVAIQINELMARPDTTNLDLADIISHDPALAAQLLKLVNSAYFGLPSKIETISQAITLIGHKELETLVIATSAVSTFKDIPEHLVDMETFWFHSVTTGIICRMIGHMRNISGKEQLFISGLLHKVGKLIFYSQYPAESLRILQYIDEGEEAMAAAEQNAFGFTHAELAGALFKDWKLPDIYHKTIAHYLYPSKTVDPSNATAALHVASNLANIIEPGVKKKRTSDKITPAHDPKTWNVIHLTDDEINEIEEQSIGQTMEILEIVKPGFGLIF